MKIAVLFARANSIYKKMPECDVYDKERDARTFTGSEPVVCHPPCRGWGRLRGLAKPEPGKLDLARLSVKLVRQNGGVLEHPETSILWKEQDLPLGQQIDEFGGFTLSVDQFWWGHRARKRTWLYIVGCSPCDLPPIPIRFDAITHGISVAMRRGRKHYKPKPVVSKAEREHTPLKFATWLVEVAKLCGQEYSKLEQNCRLGCMGPCGMCEEVNKP